MSIQGIDHINIGAADLPKTVAFFEMLGLRVGWRPTFPFDGAWMYAGDRAVVHLVTLDEAKAPSSEAALDHFAFAIDDFDDAVARLTRADIPHRAITVPDSTIRQIFVRDPNGVAIELNCRAPTNA